MTEQYSISGRINILRQALASDKNKVAFLLGAGCPLSIKDAANTPLIPGIAGLTDFVCDIIDQERIVKIKTGIKPTESRDITIEDILSRIRLLIDAIGESEFDGLKQNDLVDMEKSICKKITTVVDKELPDKITSYHNFSAWISGIPREHSVEIFTTNYDLLIESSLESKNIPYFDGFIGSKNAFFDLHSIEYEKLPARWVKLWKLHGSINWWVDKNGKVFRGTSEQTDSKQMIYPSHLKYTQSRRMPYLAMQDRLAAFLATGQSVLITIGYSFFDQHINEIIMQHLLANPRSVCFGLLYDNIERYSDALQCAKKTTNLHLFAQDAAFFAGEQKQWENDKNSNKQYEYLIQEDSGQSLCQIGDFEKFSQFLLKQTGYRLEEQNED